MNEKKMKISYIGHSGFLVELEKSLLLFDYYEGEIPDMPKGKNLFIFVSHRHPDHFNPRIFELAQEYSNAFYVLSSDIWKKRVPEHLKNQTIHLKPGVKWEHKEVKVQTLKSTDEGVAFLIKTEGITIYHAGDLNNWYWNEETDEWNREMEENFRKFIEPLRGESIDAAFIPLDPRQEENYTLGMDYFLGLTETSKVYPMHFWGEYTVIDRWLMEHPDSSMRDRVMKITQPGEVFEQ